MCSEDISYKEESISGINFEDLIVTGKEKKGVKSVKVKEYQEQLSALQVVISEIGRRKNSKINPEHFSMTGSLKLLKLVSKTL